MRAHTGLFSADPDTVYPKGSEVAWRQIKERWRLEVGSLIIGRSEARARLGRREGEVEVGDGRKVCSDFARPGPSK